MRTGSRRHRISTVFQIAGRRADSLRIGRYTNFLDTTDRLLAPGKRKYCGTAMRSVFARVRNIKDLVPQMTADEFQGALERALLASVSLGAM